uniref:CBS domain-containing protein n=1 Tax=Panagrolaimus superbus TaxID=310955 RepID=A0A914Y8S8_9BILA
MPLEIQGHLVGIWDVARMFRMNRVHRIPVVHSDSGMFNGEQPNLLYFISLRSIFAEVVIKVMDSKAAITPTFNQLKLKDNKIGTWDNIVQVSVHFLKYKISISKKSF